ncbi:MAG: hypothetical protein GEU93_02585 [Propionibacteriales bacterium]|nr:hypothetical protein [Propionibacteriales bacterium]
MLLLLAAVATLAVAGYLLATVRRLGRELKDSRAEVRILHDEMASLNERRAEIAPAPEAAEYVITTDDPGESTPVPNRAVVSATVGEPLIKVAAFAYGVRRALREEKRAYIAYQMRREFKRRRRRGRIAARRAG